jgi:hypothetical protein
VQTVPPVVPSTVHPVLVGVSCSFSVNAAVHAEHPAAGDTFTDAATVLGEM